MTDYNTLYYELIENRGYICYFFIKEESAKIFRIWCFDVPATFLFNFDFVETVDLVFDLYVEAVKKEYREGIYHLNYDLSWTILSDGVKAFMIRKEDISRMLIGIRADISIWQKKKDVYQHPQMTLDLLQER